MHSVTEEETFAPISRLNHTDIQIKTPACIKTQVGESHKREEGNGYWGEDSREGAKQIRDLLKDCWMKRWMDRKRTEEVNCVVVLAYVSVYGRESDREPCRVWERWGRNAHNERGIEMWTSDKGWHFSWHILDAVAYYKWVLHSVSVFECELVCMCVICLMHGGKELGPWYTADGVCVCVSVCVC